MCSLALLALMIVMALSHFLHHAVNTQSSIVRLQHTRVFSWLSPNNEPNKCQEEIPKIRANVEFIPINWNSIQSTSSPNLKFLLNWTNLIYPSQPLCSLACAFKAFKRVTTWALKDVTYCQYIYLMVPPSLL